MSHETSSLRVLFSRRVLVTLFLGFSSGLPLLATGSTLQVWMREAGVDLGTIGLFALVGLPYTLKFLWAPFLDAVVPPLLGRRRGWMVIAQVALMLSLASFALIPGAARPIWVAICALLTTFWSATQDIVLDAHRRDTLADRELGIGSALFVNGYRIGMLVSGAGALYLADVLPWRVVYLIIAASVGVGILATLLAPEPPEQAPQVRSLTQIVVAPLAEFFTRGGALPILAFILCYKLGDSIASAMVAPFILEVGFTKVEYAQVGKVFGLAATLIGGFAGGLFVLRIGINRALWIFGLLQAISTVGFALLVQYRADLSALAAVIAFENFSGGLGTAAYTAFMASLCNRQFSATQYALFSSLMGVPRVLLAAPSGFLAESVGWESFFMVCALAALPGMILLMVVAPWRSDLASESEESRDRSDRKSAA